MNESETMREAAARITYRFPTDDAFQIRFAG